MCVIVYKPANCEVSEDTLSEMWLHNPDGAGLAYHDNGHVRIIKGLMSLADLSLHLDSLIDRELVLHLRYATHGQVTPEQTHPFTIERTVVDAKAYSGKTLYRNAFFHNGVISGYGCDRTSDTIDFVVRTLAKIPKTSTRLDVLNLMSGNFAYLTKNRTILIGDFKEYEGLECSNLNFLYKHSVAYDYTKPDYWNDYKLK